MTEPPLTPGPLGALDASSAASGPPRYLVRRRRVLVASSIAGGLALFAGGATDVLAPLPAVRIILLLLAAGAPVVLLVWFLHAEWRVRHLVMTHLGGVCPACLYPLEAEATCCPECGGAITRAEARGVWRDYFEPDRP